MDSIFADAIMYALTSTFQNGPLEPSTASYDHSSAEGADLMGGLVMGITVRPKPGYPGNP